MTRIHSQEVAKFVVDNYGRANTWQFEALCSWIAWAMKEGFCFLIGGEDEELLGMAIVRPVMHPEKDKNSLNFDPEGDTYMIDLVVAKQPKRQVLQALGFMLLQRFGQRDKLAFQRHAVGPMYVVDAHFHRRKLLRNLQLVRRN